jgi:release factor glutamine methyltransferase
MPESNVVATDLSVPALAIARANAAAHGVADRVAFLEGDLYEALEAADAAPADFLLANPPYVAEAEWKMLQPEIRNHEPREALVAGPEGTEIIERIVRGAPAYLKPEGTLLVEIGASQGPAVRDLAAGVCGLVDVEIRKDYAGHDRMLVARRA